jgi:hypothetical protein
MKNISKRRFFEKKRAKNFYYSSALPPSHAQSQDKKSFFASFCSQKEVLTFLKVAP